MVKSQCSKGLVHEILTSNECWFMRFKGRFPLDYLGSVGLSSPGLPRGQQEGGYFLEVRPNRGAANCSSGT